MTQPTTWEQATQDVVAGLEFHTGEDWTLDEVLNAVEDILDILRHSPDLAESRFRTLARYGAVGYVHEKWGLHHDQGKSLHNAGRFHELCSDALASVLVLLPKKQHDYGPDNILWGGVQGVVVRAHDKLARIKNLKKRGTLPSNESLADSYFDLIGYGIVGAMLVKGTFQLPLEADLAAREETKSEPTWQDDVREIVREELARREKRKLSKVFIP